MVSKQILWVLDGMILNEAMVYPFQVIPRTEIVFAKNV